MCAFQLACLSIVCVGVSVHGLSITAFTPLEKGLPVVIALGSCCANLNCHSSGSAGTASLATILAHSLRIVPQGSVKEKVKLKVWEGARASSE